MSQVRDYLREGMDAVKLYEFQKAIKLFEEVGTSEADCRRAEALVDIFEYKKALKILDAVIKTDPTYAEAYAIRGHIACYDLRNDDAAALFNKALELAPDNYVSNMYYAYYLIEILDYAKSIEHAKKAQTLDPNRPEAYALEAMCLEKIHQLPEAINVIKKAIDICPDDMYVYATLGSIHMALQNYSEARKCYEMSIEKAPNYGLSYQLGGCAYASLEMDNAAVEMFKKSFSLGPKNHFLYVAYSNSLINLGMMSEISQITMQSLEKDIISAGDLLFAICAGYREYQGQDLIKLCIDKCDEMIAHNVYDCSPYFIKIILFNIIGAYDQILGVFNEFLNIDFANEGQCIVKVDMMIKTIEIISRFENLERPFDIQNKALKVLEEGLSRYPASANLQFKYACNLVEAGRYAEAIAYFEESIENGLNISDVYREYGSLLLEMKLYAEAEHKFINALQINEYDITAHSQYGYLLSLLGRGDECEIEHAKAMSLCVNLDLHKAKSKDLLSVYGKSLVEMENMYAAQVLCEVLRVNIVECARPVLPLRISCKEASVKEIGFIPLTIYSSKHAAVSASFLEVADLLIRLKHYDMAIRYCKSAIEFDKSNEDAFAFMGRIYLRQGKYIDAKEWFSKAIDLGTKLDFVYANMSTLSLMEKSYEEAKAHATKALSLVPSDEIALFNIQTLEMIGADFGDDDFSVANPD